MYSIDAVCLFYFLFFILYNFIFIFRIGIGIIIYCISDFVYSYSLIFLYYGLWFMANRRIDNSAVVVSCRVKYYFIIIYMYNVQQMNNNYESTNYIKIFQIMLLLLLQIYNNIVYKVLLIKQLNISITIYYAPYYLINNIVLIYNL